MELDEARGHEGETLVHQFLDQPPQEAELVSVGPNALHVRFAGSVDVWTMHPRTFTLKAAPDPVGRCVLEVRVDGTRSLLADLPEDGSELFVMVRARRDGIQIRKCAPGWWGADEYLSGE